jgi:hypothetical protein
MAGGRVGMVKCGGDGGGAKRGNQGCLFWAQSHVSWRAERCRCSRRTVFEFATDFLRLDWGKAIAQRQMQSWRCRRGDADRFHDDEGGVEASMYGGPGWT